MKNKLVMTIIGLFFSSVAFAGTGIFLNSAITHLESVEVNKIVKVRALKDIYQALEEAKLKGLKISIAGARHAQGGQQSYPHGIVLDMMEFNEIILLDKKNKTIRVQSGATWKQIQDYIKPYDYTVRVMQTANIFTVGGSLSSNIHGKDMKYGSIIGTVKSFHLMQADGKVINVSRQENPELFSLVIGGYGLFGIIIDVDLFLMDNVVYKVNTQLMDYKEYPGFFRSNILNNPKIGWMEAYFQKSTQGDLDTLRVTTYSIVPENEKYLTNPFEGDGKKYVSRADIMDKTFEYNGHGDVILQEYFVPINKFIFFIDGLRGVLESFGKIFKSEQRINARINVIRYIKQDKESFLPYAKADSFSLEVVIKSREPLTASKFIDVQDWVKRVVDLSLSCGGTFYLTKIAIYPGRSQLLKAYPEFNGFIEKKKQYDPQELFMNQFYDHYR